jgi:hypothetical protein
VRPLCDDASYLAGPHHTLNMSPLMGVVKKFHDPPIFLNWFGTCMKIGHKGEHFFPRTTHVHVFSLWLQHLIGLNIPSSFIQDDTGHKQNQISTLHYGRVRCMTWQRPSNWDTNNIGGLADTAIKGLPCPTTPPPKIFKPTSSVGSDASTPCQEHHVVKIMIYRDWQSSEPLRAL